MQDLKQHTEYRGWNPCDELIQWFWQIVENLSQQDAALLILFVTGTSKVPIEGFVALQGMSGLQQFQIQKSSGMDRLPSAHTCFNQLDLGEFSSKEKMEECLLMAIREGSEGFMFR